MSDIFDKITEDFITEQEGKRYAADFLAEEAEELEEGDLVDYEGDTYLIDSVKGSGRRTSYLLYDGKDKFWVKSEFTSRVAGDSHGDHSYMSRQNLNQMRDFLDTICNEFDAGTHLEDWVEDKIAHAHAALSDVSRYMEYRDYRHDDSFMKQSRLPSRKNSPKKDVDDAWEDWKEKHPEMAYWEGANALGKMNPARINKNIQKHNITKKKVKEMVEQHGKRNKSKKQRASR